MPVPLCSFAATFTVTPQIGASFSLVHDVAGIVIPKHCHTKLYVVLSSTISFFFLFFHIVRPLH